MHSKSIANATRGLNEYYDEPSTEVQILKTRIQELEAENEKLQEVLEKTENRAGSYW